MAKEVLELYEKSPPCRCRLVFAESQNIWRRRLEGLFKAQVLAIQRISRIHQADVDPILEKLRQFGPWTRLAALTADERKKELFENSSRQLLIGLLETTDGGGFTQIIRRDYTNIGSEMHAKLLVMVGLATIHRVPISSTIIGRALQLSGIDTDVRVIVNEMEGVVEHTNGKLVARHPVYVRELFERIVNPELIRDCVIALLHSFADYEAPVIRHISKTEGFIFKSIINHRFLSVRPGRY